MLSSSSSISRSAAKRQKGHISSVVLSLAITGSSRHSYHRVSQVIINEWQPLEVSDFTEEITDLPTLERTIDVMAAVVEKDGRYLICRRPEHKRHGGLWEFPGGKVHDGEDYEQATRRELAEELEVELSRFEGVLNTVRDPGSPFRIVFARVSIVGEPVLMEHTEMAWCSAEKLALYDLAPSDRCFVKSYFGVPLDDL